MRKNIEIYQGINSWGYGIHGYKGLDPSRKNRLHYYVFTLNILDTTFGPYIKKRQGGIVEGERNFQLIRLWKARSNLTEV